MIGGNNQRSGNSPRFLDWVFLLGVGLATIWAADPLTLNLDVLPFIKHVPGALVFPALVLGLILYRRGRFIAEDRSSRLVIWILVAFGLFVSAGSIYARFVNDVDNTFLTMGLYSFGAPLTYLYFRRSIHRILLADRILLTYFLLAAAASLAQFLKLNQPGLFHNREHLVIGALTLAYFVRASKLRKVLAALAIVAVGVASQKNTGFLVAAFVLLYIAFTHAMAYARRIRGAPNRMFYWAILVTFMVSGGAVAYGLSILMNDLTLSSSALPSGNPEYRTHTYDKALTKFLQSPFWGNAFTEPASEEFELYTVDVSTQILPTHSDPLDILANGGLIGIALWAGIYVLLAKKWFAYHARRGYPAEPAERARIHVISCIVFSSPITLAFNPVLNTPNSAFTLWAMIGILMSLLNASPRPIARR